MFSKECIRVSQQHAGTHGYMACNEAGSGQAGCRSGRPTTQNGSRIMLRVSLPPMCESSTHIVFLLPNLNTCRACSSMCRPGFVRLPARPDAAPRLHTISSRPFLSAPAHEACCVTASASNDTDCAMLMWPGNRSMLGTKPNSRTRSRRAPLCAWGRCTKRGQSTHSRRLHIGSAPVCGRLWR